MEGVIFKWGDYTSTISLDEYNDYSDLWQMEDKNVLFDIEYYAFDYAKIDYSNGVLVVKKNRRYTTILFMKDNIFVAINGKKGNYVCTYDNNIVHNSSMLFEVNQRICDRFMTLLDNSHTNNIDEVMDIIYNRMESFVSKFKESLSNSNIYWS